MKAVKDSIRENMVLFDKASSVDPFGRIFYYEGDVFRAISPEGEIICKSILANIKEWEKYGLVKTRDTSVSLEGYPLTIWHEKVEYKNYCLEWLPEMFKDAALQFLALNLRLLKDGFVCKDGHPWNVLFNFSKPVYIDVGSIVPYTQEIFERCVEEFIIYFLLPLLLFQQEGMEKTYEFLRLPIPNAEQRKRISYDTLDERFIGSIKRLKPKNCFRKLSRYISNIMIRDNRNTTWSHYDQKEVPVNKPHKFYQKQKAVYDFLSLYPKSDILDIGCNNGWFSILAANMGYKVVSIDNDIPSITRLYKIARKKELPILTLCVDFKNPTAEHGLSGAYPSFEERFSFDTVLAMALVHHLTYFGKMSFVEIAERMNKLTKHNLILEFIPKEDYYVSEWDQTAMEWYTRDNFIASFMKYFRGYKAVKSSPDPREVFIFSK